MARNHVHAAVRLRVLFAVAHKAGDLVYSQGFYGVVQDDIAAGKWGTLILNRAWTLANGPANVAMGTVLAAPATEIATTLPMGARGAIATVPATVGWNPVGRVIATGNASVSKVQLFNPNPAY